MLLEYSAPMKTQCIVSIPLNAAPTPAPPKEEAIYHLPGDVTCFLWEDKADAVKAFHANRKWAGGMMSLGNAHL